MLRQLTFKPGQRKHLFYSDLPSPWVTVTKTGMKVEGFRLRMRLFLLRTDQINSQPVTNSSLHRLMWYFVTQVKKPPQSVIIVYTENRIHIANKQRWQLVHRPKNTMQNTTQNPQIQHKRKLIQSRRLRPLLSWRRRTVLGWCWSSVRTAGTPCRCWAWHESCRG